MISEPFDASVNDLQREFGDDPWKLVVRGIDPALAGEDETLFSLGNGYLGLRGNHEEGLPLGSHGTFVNGLHETWRIRHAENAYGFAEHGQTIVNAPDTKTIRIYIDDERLKEGKMFGTDYFDELIEWIREIRAYEKRVYQKVRDIFQLFFIPG